MQPDCCIVCCDSASCGTHLVHTHDDHFLTPCPTSRPGATEDGEHPAATASDDALAVAPHADAEVACRDNASAADDDTSGRTSAEAGVDAAVSQASDGGNTPAAKDVVADARHANADSATGAMPGSRSMSTWARYMAWST
jgi:hypothetical protein